MEPIKIRVRPVEGRRVMFHDAPSRAITEEREVPLHPHYTRAINRGDLELVKSDAAEPKKQPKSKEG